MQMQHADLSLRCLALTWVIWPLEKSKTSSLSSLRMTMLFWQRLSLVRLAPTMSLMKVGQCLGHSCFRIYRHRDTKWHFPLGRTCYLKMKNWGVESVTPAKNNDCSFKSQVKHVPRFLLCRRLFYYDYTVVKQLELSTCAYEVTWYKQAPHYYKYNIHVHKHFKHSILRTCVESRALPSLKAKTMLAQLTQAVTHSHWH